MNKNDSMSVIVRTISDILFSFMIVYGLFTIINGHLSPGGGFQGGVIIAASMVLLFVAHGKKIGDKIFNKKIFTFIESGSALVFMGIVYCMIKFFFMKQVPQLFSFITYEPGALFLGGGFILINFAVGTKVFIGIITAVFLLGLFDIIKKDGDE